MVSSAPKTPRIILVCNYKLCLSTSSTLKQKYSAFFEMESLALCMEGGEGAPVYVLGKVHYLALAQPCME